MFSIFKHVLKLIDEYFIKFILPGINPNKWDFLTDSSLFHPELWASHCALGGTARIPFFVQMT